MKELKIKIIIDDEALRESMHRKYKRVMRAVAPVVYVLILIIIRVISPSTHKAIIQRTRLKNGVYTPKNKVFTQQNNQVFEQKNERVGAQKVEVEMHSSTLAKCANPICKEIFEYKHGKKFCSAKCKDDFHNARKMNSYYEN